MGFEELSREDQDLASQVRHSLRAQTRRFFFLHEFTDIYVPLEDKTQRILKFLFPPVQQEIVEFRSGLIVGGMGLGKTRLINYLIHMARLRYGEELNAIRSDSIETLMASMDEKKVQLLVIDDAADEQIKVRSKIIGEFFRIRHVYEDRNQTETGVIVVIWAIQGYYKLDTAFREQVDLTFFKSASGSKWHQKDLEAFLTREALKTLLANEALIKEQQKHELKSVSIVKLKYDPWPVLFSAEFIVEDLAEFVERQKEKPFEFNPDLDFMGHMQEFIRSQGPGIENWDPESCALLYPHYLSRDEKGNVAPASELKMLTGLKSHERTILRRLKALRKFLSDPDIYRQIGELFEQYFVGRETALGRKAEGFGGSSSGCDAVVDGQVYSLKCFHNERDKQIALPTHEIGEDEVRYAKEHCKGKLIVVLMNPFWGHEIHREVNVDFLKRHKNMIFRRGQSE